MSTQYGLPLAAPIQQSLIPFVVNHQSSAMIMGYFPITSTEFAGTETEIAVGPETNVSLTSVTVKQGVVDPNNPKPSQYMAHVIPFSESSKQPWLGYPSLIDVNNTGYYSDWFSTTTAIQQRFNPGNLVGALRFGLNQSTSIPDNETVPPVIEDNTVTWHAQMGIDSVNGGNLFFDFPWITQFEATSITDSSVPQVNIDPTLRIEIISNPPNGEFKAALVGLPTPTSNGDVRYDTMRIIRLKNVVELGTYEFKFRIYGESIDQQVILSLTIV